MVQRFTSRRNWSRVAIGGHTFSEEHHGHHYKAPCYQAYIKVLSSDSMVPTNHDPRLRLNFLKVLFPLAYNPNPLQQETAPLQIIPDNR